MPPPPAAELDRDAISLREPAIQGLPTIWQWVRTAEGATILALLSALWIVMHPYLGIIHDARLYTVEGLAHLDPARYANDLYFKYGSQGSFSIFGVLLAQILRLVQPDTANVGLTLLGEVLWLGCAAAFVSSLLKTPVTRAVALAAIIALSPGYGGVGVFNYAESFLTPRIFSEALVLGGLAAAFRSRWVASGILLLFAGAIHPLMAAPGILYVFCLVTLQDKRWCLAAFVAIIALAGLAAIGIEPFVRLRLTYSDSWWNVVVYRARECFLQGWVIWDYLRLLVQALIVAIALPFCTPEERHFIRVFVITVAIGVGVAGIGADFSHNVFVTNVQPWRVLWLGAVFVNLIAGTALVRIHATNNPARWYFTAGLGVYFLWHSVLFLVAPAALLLSVAFGVQLAAKRGWVERRWAVYPAFVFSVLALLCAGALVVVTDVYILGQSFVPWPVIDLATCVLMALASGALIWHRTKTAFGIAAIVLAVACLMEDRQNAWAKYVADGSAPSAELGNLIGTAKNIYWEDPSMDFLWFKLRLPSYYSCLQGTGVMFYEKTAVEYERRSTAFALLNTVEFLTSKIGHCELKANTELVGPQSIAEIASVCRSLSDLDLIVLMTKVEDWDPPFWQAPVVQYRPNERGKLEPIDRYYFYNCSRLR